ncbi:MAG: amino acid permease, partial [Erysipelotrichaceae bacterium]|nr:amino acid permease [Erysipelotrichaceae bacterium]
FLSLLSATFVPEGNNSWVDYVLNLGNYSGLSSQPAFFAANGALQSIGVLMLTIAAVCGIFTGLIGNYIALSRLLCTLSEDNVVNPWFGKMENNVPKNAILATMAISIILPFLGRTAISWIVDVTTVGATIAYAFTAAAARKVARNENNRQMLIYADAGIAISVLFALLFMVPNLLAVKTLGTESYLILTIWSILGFIYFHSLLRRDTLRRFGRSIITWVVLLGLIIVTSSIWVTQALENRLDASSANINSYYQENSNIVILDEELNRANDSMKVHIFVQMGMIILSLAILFDIYSLMQKRERQIEVEKVLAEESSKAKTSFLSNMSHEIRTPMNAIIGLDNILLRDPDITPKIKENLEKIGASAKHLLGLINDILDMSRIESGRTEIKNEEFSFREFLDQINIIINGQCLDKGLHYDCSIVNHVSDYYFGDSMKLKQVLINILGNSVKFTEPGGNIDLIVEEVDNNDEKLMKFVMKDTGIGMDKEFIPKLFEAFSQENASLTTSYGGSGLGMAITKSYIELMNGTIEVDSEKGVGSTFTVTVPLKASEKVAHSKQDLNLPENLKVIVIDDDQIACQHTQYVLQAIDIKADITTIPVEGLGMIKDAYDNNDPYDLIITDYKMPELNGLDLIHQVRTFDQGKTAVIMLTGYNWDVLEEDAKKENIGAILAKPLFADILNKEIYAILGKEGKKDEDVQVMTEETFFEDQLSGKRILIAEDVEQNAEILADLLDLEGMISEHAANGKLAMELFRDKPVNYFDAILMDVRMPIMDGLTATKEIRQLDKADATSIPIIAMTANVFDEDVERSLEAGMNAHLSKPIEPNILYETLVAYIGSDSRK